MSVLKYLSSNWSQITVLLAAIGYLVKIILDFNIRKKEIKFEYLYKEKASSFQEFLIAYQDFNALLTTQAFQYKYGAVLFADFEAAMNASKENLNNKLNQLYMYCTSKEKQGLLCHTQSLQLSSFPNKERRCRRCGTNFTSK